MVCVLRAAALVGQCDYLVSASCKPALQGVVGWLCCLSPRLSRRQQMLETPQRSFSFLMQEGKVAKEKQ
ncbi:hypothetical protein E2C01_030214 [Portunus trituberculatus]|uniref:Uncharacterized protein n=1 Tax=Portunus trituberculatus TaxID=210409 RepID=A0A5B7EUA7_PORTR|nr:hypothetical protein [Portunus trituberculatus]